MIKMKKKITCRGQISEKFALVRRTASFGKLLVRRNFNSSENFRGKIFSTVVVDNMCITQISPFYYLNRSYQTVKAGHDVS